MLSIVEREEAEDELERLNRVILAAENWAKDYSKDPKTHAKLIKSEASLERTLRKYFKNLSKRIDDYVDWDVYNKQLEKVTAADSFLVDVVIEEVLDTKENGLLQEILFDPLKTTTGIGMAAAEKIYSKELGLSTATKAIEDAALKLVGNLVGKRVNKDGELVDNPNAQYTISDTTRDQIRQSINTSISVGEDQAEATKRLQEYIADTKRAETIAKTEAVNAYQTGMYTYGKQTGAVGYQWIDLNADDECAENADEGVIPFGEVFQSGDTQPPAHPNCRCSLRLVYKEELDG